LVTAIRECECRGEAAQPLPRFGEVIAGDGLADGLGLGPVYAAGQGLFELRRVFERRRVLVFQQKVQLAGEALWPDKAWDETGGGRLLHVQPGEARQHPAKFLFNRAQRLPGGLRQALPGGLLQRFRQNAQPVGPQCPRHALEVVGQPGGLVPVARLPGLPRNFVSNFK